MNRHEIQWWAGRMCRTLCIHALDPSQVIWSQCQPTSADGSVDFLQSIQLRILILRGPMKLLCNMSARLSSYFWSCMWLNHHHFCCHWCPLFSSPAGTVGRCALHQVSPNIIYCKPLTIVKSHTYDWESVREKMAARYINVSEKCSQTQSVLTSFWFPLSYIFLFSS